MSSAPALSAPYQALLDQATWNTAAAPAPSPATSALSPAYQALLDQATAPAASAAVPGPEGAADAALKSVASHGYQPTGFDRALTGLNDFTDQAARAASFGLSDKVAALAPAVNNAIAGGPQSFSDVYHNALATERGYGNQYAANHPVASPIATTLGAVGSVAAGAPETLGLLPAIGQGIKSGGTLGALGGFGQSNDQSVNSDLSQISKGALTGAAIGGTLPAVLGGVGAGVGALGKLARPFTDTGRGKIADSLVTKFAAGAPNIVQPGEIVPGSVPTLAEVSDNSNVARLQNAVRDINPQPFDERAQANNAARGDFFGNAAGTPQDLEAAQQLRAGIKPDFRNATEANPAAVNRAINRILQSPSGQRDAVRTALTGIQNKLFVDNPLSDRIGRAIGPINDALSSGQLGAQNQADFTEARRLLNSAQRGYTSEEDLTSGLNKLANKQKIVGPLDNALGVIKEGDTVFQDDPAQLYGIRKALTDKLSPLAARAGSDAGLASRELMVIKGGLDRAIEKAAPGYTDYMQNYTAASKPIDQMSFLQGLNLTDAKGTYTLQKVQNALQNIQKLQGAKGVNAAKSLTPDQIGTLTSLRDDLLRAQRINSGKSFGSNTVQNAINNFGLGRVGRLSASALPTATGALAGGAIGHLFGYPELGGLAGAATGELAGKAMNTGANAVRQQLVSRLLNPSTVVPQVVGKVPYFLAGMPVGRKYLPAAVVPGLLGQLSAMRPNPQPAQGN